MDARLAQRDCLEAMQDLVLHVTGVRKDCTKLRRADTFALFNQALDRVDECMDEIDDATCNSDECVQLGRRALVFLKVHHMTMRECVVVTLRGLSSPDSSRPPWALKAWLNVMKKLVGLLDTFRGANTALALSSRWGSWLIATFVEFAGTPGFECFFTDYGVVFNMYEYFSDEPAAKARITPSERTAVLARLVHFGGRQAEQLTDLLK